MSEMFDENSERRLYFHESFNSYNLPSTEARDISSLEPKVKEENIEPKQTSSKSSFTYEMPVNSMMLDNVYQNQLMDKPDKPFFSHIDYSENWSIKKPYNSLNLNSSPNIIQNNIKNFININDIKDSPFPGYSKFNVLNVGSWDSGGGVSFLSNDEYSICQKYKNNIQNFKNSFFRSNPKDLNIIDCFSIQSQISLMNVRNNINGVKVNPITNSDHIAYSLNENKNKSISIDLNEEIEIRNNILVQIFNISRDTNFSMTLLQREFGEQMKHGGILVSNSMKHVNKFLNTFSWLTEYALYFENNVLSFLDKRIINLKKRIFDYAHKLINKVIEFDEYKLVCIDYDASKLIKASFNHCLLNSKLSKIFLYCQDKKFFPHNHNSKIINYIEENKDLENKAHYLLSMNLKDFIMNIFNQDENNGLEFYLKEVKELLRKIQFTEDGEKIGEDLIENKLKAIYEIDKTLSENIEDYFNSKNERKTKEVKVNNIGKNYKNKKNKKNKKKKN